MWNNHNNKNLQSSGSTPECKKCLAVLKKARKNHIPSLMAISEDDRFRIDVEKNVRDVMGKAKEALKQLPGWKIEIKCERIWYWYLTYKQMKISNRFGTEWNVSCGDDGTEIFGYGSTIPEALDDLEAKVDKKKQKLSELTRLIWDSRDPRRQF